MNSTDKKPQIQKPAWLKKRLLGGATVEKTRKKLREHNLNTVCQEAKCPNLWECFSQKTATFLILGDKCTRNCRFCAIEQGPKKELDALEPQRVAEAAMSLNLDYIVITSVTRDDIADGGANHFYKTIISLKIMNPLLKIEVLIPDFKGCPESVSKVGMAQPDVINHNIETVKRLYPSVRPAADYYQSLKLISMIRTKFKNIKTKSGLMVGLGETYEETIETFKDLKNHGCQILTIGQYLQPTPSQTDVVEYIHPDIFKEYQREAENLGFESVTSGPFVRSSYQAKEIFYSKVNS